MQIDGIEAVRVHIVIPEKTLFKEDQKEPTASVILRLKQGAKLSRTMFIASLTLLQVALRGLNPKMLRYLIQGKRCFEHCPDSPSLPALI